MFENQKLNHTKQVLFGRTYSGGEIEESDWIRLICFHCAVLPPSFVLISCLRLVSLSLRLSHVEQTSFWLASESKQHRFYSLLRNSVKCSKSNNLIIQNKFCLDVPIEAVQLWEVIGSG